MMFGFNWIDEGVITIWNFRIPVERKFHERIVLKKPLKDFFSAPEVVVNFIINPENQIPDHSMQFFK